MTHDGLTGTAVDQDLESSSADRKVDQPLRHGRPAVSVTRTPAVPAVMQLQICQARSSPAETFGIP